jgi:outer membrane lipoprotein SlyB
MTIKILSLLLLLFLAGCSKSPDNLHWDYADIQGKVIQIRILQNGETIVHDENHPVVGAIVGHAVIGGTAGAIIGTVAGSGDVTKEHTEEVAACELFIKTEDGTVHKFFLNGKGESTNKCALAQPGDEANVQKHWLHDSKSTTESFFSWDCRTNWNGGFNCAKEERP